MGQELLVLAAVLTLGLVANSVEPILYLQSES